MAKEEKAKETAQDSPESFNKKRSMVTVGLFGGVMILEGVAIFVGMKFLGAQPDPTAAMDLATTRPFSETREFDVAQLRVLNSNGSRTMLYSVAIGVTIDNDEKKTRRVEDFFALRRQTINDVLSRVIRTADEKHLEEPGLETIKRQVKFELGNLLNDDTLIQEVLVPEFTPLPTGY